MASTKTDRRPTLIANITGLLKELLELGQRTKPVEYQRPEQQAAVVVKGK